MEETVYSFTRKKGRAYYIINWIITIMCTVMVILLRRDVLPSIFNLSNVPFSTTDFFFIVCTSLCGFVYGMAMYVIVFICEIISLVADTGFAGLGQDMMSMFSTSIYIVLVLFSTYFAAHRWYAGIKKTIAIILIFCMMLANSWYLMFVFLNIRGETNLYNGHSSSELMLGSNPEVFLAVLTVFLILRFLPDRFKVYLGTGHLYTHEYEEYLKNNTGTRKATISTKVTVISFVEAVLLSLVSVAIFDFQLTHAGPGAGQLMMNGAPGSLGEMGPVKADGSLLRMNIQLILLTLSISLPVAVLFNEIILRIVVSPINRISNAMDKFFSGETDELSKHLDMLDRLHIQSGDEMEKLYNNMRKMVRDMNDHIDALERERQLEADLAVAEAKSEAKSSFLSNVSHEIRTPINAVLGMDEMILRESREENTLKYAENIRTAGNSLLGLVNDILDFSKIEAGKMDIIEVNYDFASTLNDLVNMISTRASDKGLKLIVNVNPDMPHLLHGDEIRIKQVVTNILTNAVKYTEKGSVTMKVDYYREISSGDGDTDSEDKTGAGSEYINLKVSIRDTGIGIKDEDKEKLFAAFERIEEERNRTIEGTGLGMNITQTLLGLMGSRLEVESVYGEGSCFSFSIKQGVVDDAPIGDYEEALKKSIASRKKYHESFRAPDALILVTDDTQMNLTVIENLLKRTQVQLEFALSGDECLAKTREKKYDLIFLDHRMPEKDGIETLTELKAMEGNPNLDTPVVCLTANAVSGAKDEYLSAGFDDYLTKPIDPAALEEMIVKFLPEDKILGTEEDIGSETVSDRQTHDGVSDVSDRQLRDGEMGVPDRLRAAGSVDVDKGIANSGGEEGYLSVLKSYSAALSDNIDLIDEYYRSEDYDNYTIKVHAIKSSSRIIGALNAGDLAEKLEHAGDDRDIGFISEHTDELLDMLRKLDRDLKAALGEEGQPGLQDGNLSKASTDGESLNAIDAGTLREAYEALTEFAYAYDADSCRMVMDEIQAYSLPDDDAERFGQIGKNLNRLDWDGILEILNSVN